MKRILLSLLSLLICIQSVLAGSEDYSQQGNFMGRELASFLADFEKCLNEAESSGDLSKLFMKSREDKFKWMIDSSRLERTLPVEDRKKFQAQIENHLRRIYRLSGGNIPYLVTSELRVQILYSDYAPFSLIKDIFEDSWKLFKNTVGQSFEKLGQIRIFIYACSHSNFYQEKWIDRCFDLLSDFIPNDQCSMMESLALNPNLSKKQAIRLLSSAKEQLESSQHYFSGHFLSKFASNFSAVKEIGETIFEWVNQKTNESFQNRIYRILLKNPSTRLELLRKMADRSFSIFQRIQLSADEVEEDSFLHLVQNPKAYPLVLDCFEYWIENLKDQISHQIIFLRTLLISFSKEGLGEEEPFSAQRRAIVSKIIRKLKDWSNLSHYVEHKFIEGVLLSVLEVNLIDSAHIDDLIDILPKLKDLNIKRNLLLTLLPIPVHRDQLRKLWGLTNGYYKRQDVSEMIWAVMKNQILNSQDLDWFMKRTQKIGKGEVFPWEPFPEG